jgi:Pentapeptide repeats (9 copies)
LFDKAFFQWPKFSGVTFTQGIWFDDAVFSGETHFDSTTFKKSSSFVNAEMKGETSFEGATFKTEPPQFFGAKLHQGTVWRGIKRWPTPKKADEAGAFIDAYSCLKLEMDRLKKHEDELDFFALELQSRRVLLGPWGRGLPIWLYGVLSDYGRSYVWPFVWLFAVAAFGAAIFRHFGALTLGEATGLSAANTLNVFGFRKDFFDTDFMKSLPAWLEVVSALQTIVGTILLFLFGLGIRNKFRMK